MPNISSQELARLRETHRPRDVVRQAFKSAEIGLIAPGYELAVYAGYDQQMKHTTQEIRDANGVTALASLNKAIAAFEAVRDQLAELLAAEAPEKGERPC